MLDELKMKEIEETIRAAIAKAQAEGIEICYGAYNLAHSNNDCDFTRKYEINSYRPNKCCPIAALVLHTDARPRSNVTSDAANILGISREEVLHFVYSFDGSLFSDSMGALGKKLKEELKPTFYA